MIHTDFDPCKKAIINPEDAISKNPDMPENFIGIFSQSIVEKYAKLLNATVIGEFKSCSYVSPIWKATWHDGTEFAFANMFIGGPGAICAIEESVPMGAKRFVMFGSCGALKHEITAGHIIVPEAAIRDEGISYHYLPAADEIALDPDCVSAVCKSLESLGAPYVCTKTWTTDAFYRETAAKVEKRKAQGCSVVEMECASLAAVAQFREIKFAQFLWAADSLAGTQWDSRNLDRQGIDESDLYFEAAVRTFKFM